MKQKTRNYQSILCTCKHTHIDASYSLIFCLPDRTGGVVPSVARKLHEENIDLVTSEAIEKANINIQVYAHLTMAIL